LLAHGRAHGRGRGFNSGGFPPAFPEDRNFPGRVGFFDLVASAHRERGADEAAKENGTGKLPGGDYRTGRGKRRPTRDFGALDNLLSGSVDRINLQRAVEQLPPGYRSVFELHDIQGYEHNEIAGIMGCSIGNSKSQLHKARTRLRELLQEAIRQRAREARQDAKTETAGHDAP